MKKFEDAKIGQRVRYDGEWKTIGVCEGVIVEIYPSDIDDCVCVLGYAAIQVDEPLPEHWPYPDNNFAPALNNLEVLPDEI